MRAQTVTNITRAITRATDVLIVLIDRPIMHVMLYQKNLQCTRVAMHTYPKEFYRPRPWSRLFRPLQAYNAMRLKFVYCRLSLSRSQKKGGGGGVACRRRALSSTSFFQCLLHEYTGLLVTKYWFRSRGYLGARWVRGSVPSRS